ncbi:MAG: DNA polymerase I [Planctomycetes bacterium]|nr:DNA polymerase I [Planctomycetota bacterium]
MPKSLYIIDGYSQIFRAYYSPAARRRSVRGKPVGAVYLFTRMLVALMRKHKPDYLVCTLDPHGPTFRDELYADYKATRDEMPEDLREQLPTIRAMIEACGVPIYETPGLEADDVIGILSLQAEKQGMDVRLVSRDKDLKQLLSDRVMLINEEDGSTYGPAELKAEFGLTPPQFIEVLALAGDTVDNIPGAKGVGQKTAAKLLCEYGTMAKIFAAAESGAIKQPKLRENLVAFKPESVLSRQLTEIVRDGERGKKVRLDPNMSQLHPLNKEKLLPLLVELNFNSIIEELGWKVEAALLGGETGAQTEREASASGAKTAESAVSGPQTADREKQGAAKPVQKALFGGMPARPEQPPPPPELAIATGKYAIVDKAAFKALVARLKAAKTFAMFTVADEPRAVAATETDEEEDEVVAAAQPLQRRQVLGVAFAFAPGDAAYVPVSAVALPAMTDALKPVFEEAKIGKIGHDIKRDMRMWLGQGVAIRGVVSDTKLDAFLLDTSREDAKLDSLSREFLQLDLPDVAAVAGGDKRHPGLLADAPVARVGAWGAQCADFALRVSQLLLEQVKAQKMDKLATELELPLIQVLAAMEYEGIKIDKPYLAKLSKEMQADITRIEAECHKLASCTFTVNSPKQLAEVLFDKLQLPVQGKTARGKSRSTDMSVLEKLAPMHPLPKLIVDYRHLAKLRSTYVEQLPLLADEKDRVHTTYRQTVATGRLSSNDPNVQNIPVRTELGRKIRRAFIAEKDCKLISADYSQIELRLLAHISGDEHLTAAFKRGEDIHKAVAAKVFGVAEKDVSKDQRNQAKTVNFGVIYGQGAFGLSQQLGIGRADAQAFIDNYFANYPRVRELINEVIAGCRKDNFVTTLFGRRRYLPEIQSKNAMLRAQAERQAFNSVLQGTAADLIKRAMLAGQREIEEKKLPWRMLLQVHDELVFEAPKKEADACSEFAKRVMSEAMTLKVPLLVEAGIGDNWLDAK